MEFILTALESSRLDAAQDAVDHHCYDDVNTDVIISDRRRLQESFDAFAKALRRFVSDLHDTEMDDERVDRRHTSTPTLAAASSSSQSKTTTSTTTTSLAMATWLYETCSIVPSPLPTLQLALEILSVANRTRKTSKNGIQNYHHYNEEDDDDNNDESSKMQSSLFELFGEGEQSIEAMFQVMEKLDSIRKDVSEMDLRSVAKIKEEAGNTATTTAMSATAITSSTLRLEQQLQQLRAEAYEAANLATALRTDLHSTMTTSSTNFASRGTHSVTRKSDKDAEKSYKRAVKQALNTLNKAREAGALTEYDDIFLKDQLSINTNNNSNINSNGRNVASAVEQMMLRNEEAMLFNSQHARGLDRMTSQQIASMKLNLHPEGTRQYNDGSMRGLPAGTEREIKEGQYEKVIIPAHVLDKSMLRKRIDLDEVLGKDTDKRAAFDGTRSLNPMQSTVFDAAYNTRENLLICAPTGKRERARKRSMLLIINLSYFLFLFVIRVPLKSHAVNFTAHPPPILQVRVKRMLPCSLSFRTCGM